MKSETAATVRALISVPLEMHEIMDQLARKKKVSLASLVRDAVERHIVQQTEKPRHERELATEY